MDLATFFVMALILLPLCITGEKYTGPINQAGMDMIRKREKFKQVFYIDQAGVTTIGIGHNCHFLNCTVPINGKYNVPLTRDDGEALFREDVAGKGGFASCVNEHVTYEDLNENQFSAFVSLAFDIGCDAFKESSVVAQINVGNVNRAAESFASYVLMNGRISKGMRSRRLREKELFCRDGVCEDGKICRIVLTHNDYIRYLPNTYGAHAGLKIVNETLIVSEKVEGEVVDGNPFWFKTLFNYYFPAAHSKIRVNNGEPWCSVHARVDQNLRKPQFGRSGSGNWEL